MISPSDPDDARQSCFIDLRLMKVLVILYFGLYWGFATVWIIRQVNRSWGQAPIPSLDGELTRWAVERKLDSLSDVAIIGMTWWVSSIALLAGVIAATWKARQDLSDEPDLRRDLHCLVNVFTIGVILFGFFLAAVTYQIGISASNLVQSMREYHPLIQFDDQFNGTALAVLGGVLSFAMCFVGWWQLMGSFAGSTGKADHETRETR